MRNSTVTELVILLVSMIFCIIWFTLSQAVLVSIPEVAPIKMATCNVEYAAFPSQKCSADTSYIEGIDTLYFQELGLGDTVSYLIENDTVFFRKKHSPYCPILNVKPIDFYWLFTPI